jgi:formylglycine-generating enzyme
VLPTEEQWEYVCRGSTRTLFFFGDDLAPTQQALAALVDYGVKLPRTNRFGLVGLFVGEWCGTKFRKRYDEVTSTDDHVVRGGASVFWPWQGSEWAYCVSAMRMPSSDLIGGMSGARFVCPL